MDIKRRLGGSGRVRGASRVVALALALVAPMASGCSEDEGPPPVSRRRIEIKNLPETVLGAAKKALPGITFEEAWGNLDRERQLQSYEIKGRAANGKIREARVALDGKILETE